jgi:hypothetical protein
VSFKICILTRIQLDVFGAYVSLLLVSRTALIKMITDLMWFAGTIFHNTFQRFWRVPVRFDPERRYFVHEFDVKEFKRWKFRNVYCASTVSLLISVEGLWNALNQTGNISYFRVVALSMSICVAITNLVVPTMIILYGERAMSSMNHMVCIEREVKADYPKLFVHKRWDIRGLLLCGAASFFGILPYLMIFIPSRNVLSLTINEFIGTENQFLRLLISISCSVIWRMVKFTIIFETCRSLCGGLFMLILIIEIVLKVVPDIMRLGLKNGGRIRKYCEWYNRIILCSLANQTGMANFISLLMGVGLILSVASNTVAIKLHSVVPKPFYFLFPGVSVLILFMINCTLPRGIEVNLVSKELLRVWKNHVPYASNRGNGNLSRKYLVRKLAALRQIMVYAGIEEFNLFSFSRDLKLDYYNIIRGFTIDAILSLPTF